jgi:hypothetical protein
MRVNVYTEELTGEVQVVRAEYTDSEGQKAENWGIRFVLKSHPDLHHQPKDDDRSAVTFWCGRDWANMKPFLQKAFDAIYDGSWSNK